MSKRKLLLADDSVTIQKVVNLTFADEGIEVIAVGDGDSAMEKIAEVSPDVVLADVHMPGLSGYQICEIIRENPRTKDMPVVLLVGSFEPFDEAEAERVGANAYLTKPFQSIRQLVSQVSELMESRSSAVDGHRSGPETPFATDPVESSGSLPDTTDIDSLYHQSLSGNEPRPEMPTEGGSDEHVSSFERTGEHGSALNEDAEAAGDGSRAFVDAGMDDEMIETRHVDEPVSHFDPAWEENVDGEADQLPTSGLGSYPDQSDDAVPGAAAPYDQQRVDTGTGIEEPPVTPSPFDSIATADEMEAADPGGSAKETYFEEIAQTGEIPELASPNTRDFDLDEIELLDLPPLAAGKTLEFTTSQKLRAQGGGKEVVSLSPELIDVIVQKVVEKLSEKY